MGSPEPPPPPPQGSPLAAVKTVSLVSIFSSLAVMCLGVIFLCFVLWRTGTGFLEVVGLCLSPNLSKLELLVF